MNELKQHLKNHSLKATGPRLAVLSLLSKSHGPFTAEEIHKKLAKSSLDRVTVYRVLNQLQDRGIVSRLNTGAGAARYELHEEDHHHHHITCRSCKKTETIEKCWTDPLEKELKNRGFSNLRHTLEFQGTCHRCKS